MLCADAASQQDGQTGSAARFAAAARDLCDGFANWRLWTLLGWRDVQRRYRRSVFGPLWTTLSMAIFVAALGVLYAKLFNQPAERYVPHLTLGFLAWIFLAGVVGGSCNVFVAAERYIKEIGVPLSTFVYQIVWQNAVMLFYQSFVYLGVALVFDIRPGAAALLALAGLALLVVNAVWIALLLGLVATRFRDVPEIVDNVVRIVFFLTPILWMQDMVGERTEVFDFNPFYHFVELLRAPLLGAAPPALSWIVAAGLAAAGWPLTFLVFARLRGRLAYWL